MVEIDKDIPQNVSDFLRHINQLSGFDVQQYIVSCIEAQIVADLDHVSDTPFWTSEKLKTKYDL